MFAEVRTLVGEPQTVLTVPDTAISFNTYGDFVVVLEAGENGRFLARRRQVETGESLAGQVVIRAGLSGDETLIRAGLNKVRPGQAVVIDNSVELSRTGVETP
jgi:membrane fusion protein (multidrug efflux system)